MDGASAPTSNDSSPSCRPTLVALVDLDYFKQINDSRGHEVGDEVLMEVANRLVAAELPEAVLFRWGGEEFLLLAPLADDIEPNEVAGKILHRIGDAPIEISSGNALWTTCSIGWEIAPSADSLSIHAALRQADLNLYQAKKDGRDRANGSNGVVNRRQGQ